MPRPKKAPYKKKDHVVLGTVTLDARAQVMIDVARRMRYDLFALDNTPAGTQLVAIGPAKEIP